MKGATIEHLIQLILAMVIVYIILMIMTFPPLFIDKKIPDISQRHKEICSADTVNRWIDSCFNDTVILREEGVFETKQIDKYSCKYILLYKTGSHITIPCYGVQKCYMDLEYDYNIAKCR